MATKNVKTTSSFEPLGKLPSNTLKRHPKMELNKADLLRLLSYLEGELQARDVTIAALKAEKAKQMLYQAKYGRFGLGDPFLALQRDADRQKDNSFDEAAVKAMYDNQLTQLENLIATQGKAQQRMREQLAAVEKRYHKVLAELEDEKRKHAQDTAQGDDVTYMLEKERERLKQEVDFEKGQVKKLEKDLKKVNIALEEERAISAKHKQVAIMLIKDRKRLLEQIADLEKRTVVPDQERTQDSQISLQFEAAMEKHLSEFDIEREQLRGRLSREEKKNNDLYKELSELTAQVESLTKQLAANHPASERRPDPGPSAETRTAPQGDGPCSGLPTTKVPQLTNKVFRNTPPNTPPEARRTQDTNEKPPQPASQPGALPGQTPGKIPGPTRILPAGSDSNVKRAIMQFSNTSPTKEKTILDKITPSEKPAEMPALRNASGPSGSTVAMANSGGPAVLSTTGGAKVAMSAGGPGSPASSSNLPRKTGVLAGRGSPPPIPPNKPAYVPSVTPQGVKSTPRFSSSPSIAKPAPPTKFGITISKDKITISNPEPNVAAGQRSVIGGGGADAARSQKPSQATKAR